MRLRLTAITLTVLAHTGVCALICLAGPVSVAPAPAGQEIRVAVLEDHPQVPPRMLPRLHLVRPARLHVMAPVLPVSHPPPGVFHVTGAGSITLPPRKRSRAVKAMLKYPALISLALSQVKRYPLSERMAHHQGQVWLALHIAPDGHLLRVSLQHSCGVSALDRVALAMAWAAAPFPAVPSGKAVFITVPITFSLNA